MSAKTIHDLPTEVLVSIFSRLKLQSVIQDYSRTCLRWKRIIAKYFLEPHLLKITEFDEDLSLGIKLLTKDGFDLTENCNDPDLVMSIYYDLECFEKYGCVLSYIFNVQSMLSKVTVKNLRRMVDHISYMQNRVHYHDRGMIENVETPGHLIKHRTLPSYIDLGPQLDRLANSDTEFKMTLRKFGWTADCQNDDLIKDIFETFERQAENAMLLSFTIQLQEMLNYMNSPKINAKDIVEYEEYILDLTDINTKRKSKAAVAMIFEMAIVNPNTAQFYALLCKVLEHRKVDSFSNFHQKVAFHCQDQLRRFGPVISLHIEDERSLGLPLDYSTRPFDVKINLKMWRTWKDNLSSEKMIQRFRGMIQFIAELYNKGWFSVQGMHELLMLFTESIDEILIECLHNLVLLCGKKLDFYTRTFLSFAEMEEGKSHQIVPINDYIQKIGVLSKTEQLSDNLKVKLAKLKEIYENNWDEKVVANGPAKL